MRLGGELLVASLSVIAELQHTLLSVRLKSAKQFPLTARYPTARFITLARIATGPRRLQHLGT